MKRIGMLVLVLLAGCATAKPPLGEQGYVEIPEIYVDIYRCGATGLMDADTAALGSTYTKTSLSRYTHDSDRINAAVRSLGSRPKPTQEKCNQLAMEIRQKKQQIDNHNQSVTAQEQAVPATSWPKQTICNRIGTQNLCTTY